MDLFPLLIIASAGLYLVVVAYLGVLLDEFISKKYYEWERKNSNDKEGL